MVAPLSSSEPSASIPQRAARVKLVVADVDGVLTDGGVYYGADGEVMKRFSIRDGMGVERLRDVGVPTAIITGEASPSVDKRAAKLSIDILYLSCKDKPGALREIMEKQGVAAEEIAYIGDDVNDLEAMKLVGLAACPADAVKQVREIAHYVCAAPGGHGAFRELAEQIIEAKSVEERERTVGFG